MRTLIIGADRDSCSMIEEFLRARGLFVTVVLNYKDGIDKLFYEKPDVTIIELFSHELSPTLVNKIEGSDDFELIDFAKQAEAVRGGKPVLIVEEKSRLDALFDFLAACAPRLVQEEAHSESQNKVESGYLESTAYPILLAKLHNEKRTGILKISSSIKLRIYLLNGVPIFAEGGDVGTALGKMLVSSEKIAETDYEDAIELAAEKKQKLGEILVAMGLISPHELNNFLEIQIKEKIISGFKCHDGMYDFKSEDGFADRMVAYQINLPQVLYEGVKRHIEIEDIEEIFFHKGEDTTVEPTPHLSEQMSSLGLGPRELRFMQLRKDRESVGELLKTSRLTKDGTLKLLYFLLLLGLVKVTGLSFPPVEKASSKRTAMEKIMAGRDDGEAKAPKEDLIVLEEEIAFADLGHPTKPDGEDEENIDASYAREKEFRNPAEAEEIEKVDNNEIEIGWESVEEEIEDEIRAEGSEFSFGQDPLVDEHVVKRNDMPLEPPAMKTIRDSSQKADDSFGQTSKEEAGWKNRKGIEIGLDSGDKGLSIPKIENTEDSLSQVESRKEEVRKKKEEQIGEILELYNTLQAKSHYQILGVNKGASKAEIKSAYFNLVKKFHPDAHPDLNRDIREKTGEIFTKITVAYEILTDQEKRADYDSHDEVEKVKSQVKVIYDAEVAFKEGEAFLKQRRYREAEEKLLKAVNLNPEEGAYVGALAWARFVGGNEKDKLWNDTKKELERAITINPKVAENFYYLGSIYKHADDLRKAEANFLKAVDLDPEFIEAKRELRLLQQRRSETGIKDKKKEKKFWSSLFKK